MHSDFARTLSRARDKFVFVLAHPYLYRTEIASIRDVWHVVESQLHTRDDRLAAELGFTYVARRHEFRSRQEVISLFDRFVADAGSDGRTLMRVRLTRAACLLTSFGEFDRAKEEFEDCASKLRIGEDHIAYAVCCKGLGDASLSVGDPRVAEESYETAVALFRRYNCRLLLGYAYNNLGVAKKRSGQFDASVQYLTRARDLFELLDVKTGLLDVSKNLGFVCMKKGDWRGARKWFDDACAHRDFLLGIGGRNEVSVAELSWSCATMVEHLALIQRSFADARHGLETFIEQAIAKTLHPWPVALAHEFLGELFTEIGEYDKAAYQLAEARRIASDKLPRSDVMSEILRREAQLHLCEGRLQQARDTATASMRLSTALGDRYELGAAMRVRGEAYAASQVFRRAEVCFRSSVQTLKRIGECYELMRALYAQGRFFDERLRHREAEQSLHDAYRLSQQLDLAYYEAMIAIALADVVGSQGRFDEARSWLDKATTRESHLEPSDSKQVTIAMSQVAKDLQSSIARTSARSAETIKTICNVYADTRFPFDDMRADLVYQVAQSVGCDSLWVMRRKGGGYHVSLMYNVAADDAKRRVRELGAKRVAVLDNVGNEPVVFALPSGQALAAVGCRTRSNRESGHVLYAHFLGLVALSSRKVEMLCAGAEALARLVENDEHPHIMGDGESGVEKSPRRLHGPFSNILTNNGRMIELMRLAERAAVSVAPILLEGETGVGKEVFARAIHASSQRRHGPFVAVNAGGMSLSLLESELFGHVRGAFTDARAERLGLVEFARGGSLFLDEIGEMGEELQVKFLRLLENGEYRRLGDSNTRTADVRVITATNRDLRRAVETGRFRRDLYYRVSPVKLVIPPLRMRSDDVGLLVRHFVRECAERNGIEHQHIELDGKTMEALQLYSWPGNIRELYNEVMRLVSLMGENRVIRVRDLSDSIKEFLQTHRRNAGQFEQSVEQYERRLILQALESNGWNRMKTADAIGIPRTTLLAKLKRLNVSSRCT